MNTQTTMPKSEGKESTERDYKDNIFHVSDPSEIDVEAFSKVMKRDTFAGFRGIVSPDEVKTAMKLLTAQFSPENDHPGVGKDTAAKVKTNFQKLNVGGESMKRSNDDARLFRAFYNPIWEEDIYGMRDIFKRLSRVRNVIAGEPLEFAVTEIEPNGLWTAARLHQYPAGGGFFKGHTDYVVNDIAKESNTDFYQLLLLMSEKGVDFTEGGGFVDIGGKRIILEDHFEPGDVMVYDGRTHHGVEDIDPHLPLDMTRINGRVSAFVTLFKSMT